MSDSWADTVSFLSCWTNTQDLYSYLCTHHSEFTIAKCNMWLNSRPSSLINSVIYFGITPSLNTVSESKVWAPMNITTCCVFSPDEVFTAVTFTCCLFVSLSAEIRWLTWLVKNLPFLCLERCLVALQHVWAAVRTTFQHLAYFEQRIKPVKSVNTGDLVPLPAHAISAFFRTTTSPSFVTKQQRKASGEPCIWL